MGGARTGADEHSARAALVLAESEFFSYKKVGVTHEYRVLIRDIHLSSQIAPMLSIFLEADCFFFFLKRL